MFLFEETFCLYTSLITYNVYCCKATNIYRNGNIYFIDIKRQINPY